MVVSKGAGPAWDSSARPPSGAAASGSLMAVGSGFAAPLVAVVTDAFGNLVAGVSVTFDALGTGATATMTGSPAVTGGNGQASVTATAGTVAGSYIVVAAAENVTSAAVFMLANTSDNDRPRASSSPT